MTIRLLQDIIIGPAIPFIRHVEKTYTTCDHDSSSYIATLDAWHSQLIFLLYIVSSNIVVNVFIHLLFYYVLRKYCNLSTSSLVLLNEIRNYFTLIYLIYSYLKLSRVIPSELCEGSWTLSTVHWAEDWGKHLRSLCGPYLPLPFRDLHHTCHTSHLEAMHKVSLSLYSLLNMVERKITMAGLEVSRLKWSYTKLVILMRA